MHAPAFAWLPCTGAPSLLATRSLLPRPCAAHRRRPLQNHARGGHAGAVSRADPHPGGAPAQLGGVLHRLRAAQDGHRQPGRAAVELLSGSAHGGGSGSRWASVFRPGARTRGVSRGLTSATSLGALLGKRNTGALSCLQRQGGRMHPRPAGARLLHACSPCLDSPACRRCNHAHHQPAVGHKDAAAGGCCWCAAPESRACCEQQDCGNVTWPTCNSPPACRGLCRPRCPLLT